MERSTHSGVTARRHAFRREAWIVYVLVCAAVTVSAILQLRSWNWTLFDTRIYLDATTKTLNGTADLYDGRFGDGWPFTYPPFAVLAFAPLAALARPVGTALLTIGSLAALFRICWLVADRSIAQWRLGERVGVAAGTLAPLAAAAAVLLAARSDAVAGTFAFGQINLVMAWLVVEDYLGAGRRRIGRSGVAGVLTGLAAGVKVTPALAAVPRLFTREYATALRALGAGVVTLVLSAAVLPHEVVTYFTSALWDTDRPGAPESEWNQSLSGFVARVLHDVPGAGGVRWALVTVALVAGLYLTARLLRRGDDVGAVLVVFVTTGSVSPITWYHHLVLVPLFGVWAILATRRWARGAYPAVAAQAVLLGLWVLTGLYQSVPRDNGAELHHTLLETLISEAVPVLSLTIVVTLAVAMLRVDDGGVIGGSGGADGGVTDGASSIGR